MADFKLSFNESEQCADLDLEYINQTVPVDVETGNDLITSVIISLLSDRVADSDWTYTLDKRGWWGDAENSRLMGSSLWQLSVLPTANTQEYLMRAEGYANSALQWLVDDNICKTVECVASFVDARNTHLNLDITLTKADSSVLRYSYVWDR
ncbi:phage GP46 family protein [Gluconobacter frateurii]|nr:phage GP46 family protein [Gluconobacter frateurii]GLP89603.1 hypothetical protein GCM10007868_06780 [Gluconobacter frateurii]